jgi:hypothetical protein
MAVSLVHPDRKIIEIAISPHVCAAVSARALDMSKTLSTSIEEDPTTMAERGAAILRDVLPKEAQGVLDQLGRSKGPSIVVLRRAAELDAPATPINGIVSAQLLAPQDILLAGAMRLAGTEPCAFSFENQGRIARNVVANPAQRGMASSHGYDMELFWHQDNCGQPFEGESLPGCDLPPMPKQLGFFAVRNSECVPTRVLLVDQILDLLADETMGILSAPRYRIGAPDSVAAEGYGNTHIEPAPIVRVEDDSVLMRYDPFLVSTKDPAAFVANARLTLALAEAEPRAVDIVLGPGDIMILSNYRVLHMRVAFEPDRPERSRWLRRFYGRRATDIAGTRTRS